MNWQRILIMLAILSFGMEGTHATIIVSDTLSSDAGQLWYNINYEGGSQQGDIVESAVLNDNYISYSVTGINIDGANTFDSYMRALANANSGPFDYADAWADIDGSIKIVNYCLFGYVTRNLAYAGQYADFIQANHINMWTDADTAHYPDYYAQGQSQIYFENTHATDIVTATNVWQDGMAGGSYNPAEYPQGIWAMTDIYEPTKLTAGADSNNNLFMCTGAYYQDGRGGYMGAGDEPQPSGQGVEGWDNFIDLYGIRPSMTVNSQSMGYADSKIVYANLDTTLAGQVASPDFQTYSMRQGLTSYDPAYTSIDRDTDPPLYSTSKGAFLYSLVDLNNLPNGKSDLIFY